MSGSTPTVTIVTPSYNQGRFIRATIESVLSQDYPNIEYIVMDGGSTDETAAILSEYTGRLTWISEKDRGQAHAINKGFRQARGDILAWLNSDDVLLPGAVGRAVAALVTAPRNTGAIYGDGYLMDCEGRFTRPFPFTEPFNLWKLVHVSDYIPQQSAFFRSTAVQEIGWLDEDLHYALDWDLFIRLGKRFRLHYVAEDFGALREYREAKSFAGGRRRIEEIRLVLERHTGLKHAPGYWIYGLESFQREWKDRLEAHVPAWLRPAGILMNFFVRVASTGVVLLILHRRNVQGLYRDRSVGPKLKWMLPAGAGDVIVRGRVPEQAALRGQMLAVRVAGRRLARWTVGPGAFTLRFTAPAERDAPFSFEVNASRWKWRRAGPQLWFRPTAWILESIDWADSAVGR